MRAQLPRSIARPRPVARLAAVLVVAVALLLGLPLVAQEGGGDAPARGDRLSGFEQAPDAIHLKSGSFVPPRGIEARARSRAAQGPGWLGLIQFEELPSDSERAQLAAVGVELLDYVPNRAWIARMPAGFDGLQAVASVRWVGELLPQDKLAPELARQLPVTGAAGGQVGLRDSARRVVEVSAFDGLLGEAQARVAALGGRVLSTDPALEVVVAEIAADRVLNLARHPAVRWVGPEPPVKVPFNNESLINTRVGEVQAAPYSLSGSGVQLGIWDGGRIFAHTDFSSRLTMIDLGMPLSGHATHVTGTMAGDGSLGPALGLPNGHLRGASTAGDIIGYDFNGSTVGEHNAAINTHGIDLSQNSWGYDIQQALGNCSLYGNYDTLARGYDQVITGLYGARIPVVFAAGNERNDGDCGMSAVPPFLNYGNISPPATAKNVISVGAVNGDDDAMTTFSSWGPTDDGRLKPEITAPGCNAVGLQGLQSIISTVFQAGPTSWYGGSCGTSMAAPAVSGSIGLLLERYRDVCPAGGTDPRPSTVRALLVHGARDRDDASAFLNRGPDYASGYGDLDTKNSVDLLPFHLEDTVANGQTRTYQITVSQQEDLKVTLVWDDPAASVGAAVTLVNNLDLELVDPLGGIHRPWILNPASPGNAATRGVDNRNTIEQVVVDTVTSTLAGTWTIRVTGTSVPSGPQTFTLVNQHLTQSSCAGAPTTADAWIMDKDVPLSPVDPGTEPNPDPTGMWKSNWIWVRNNPGPGTTHQNPIDGQTNYIHAKVRNQGSATVHTTRAMVYYAQASTGLSWPTQWHLIGSSTVIDLSPSGVVEIAPVPWDPPGPGHYCLYVRLLSDQDPMTFPEGPGVTPNTRNNNNIAWRNVNVIPAGPGGMSEGNVVLVRNVLGDGEEVVIAFETPEDRMGVRLLDVADVKLRLSEKSRALLEEQGLELQGQGFERIDDLTFEIVSPRATFEPLVLPGLATLELDLSLQIDFEALRAYREKGWRGEELLIDALQNILPGSNDALDEVNQGGITYQVQIPQ